MGLGHEKLDVYRLSIGYVEPSPYENTGVDLDLDGDFDMGGSQNSEPEFGRGVSSMKSDWVFDSLLSLRSLLCVRRLHYVTLVLGHRSPVTGCSLRRRR